MHFQAKLKNDLKNIDRFSILLLYHGLQFACCLAAMSLLFYVMAGRANDYLYMISCARGAFDAAVTTAVGCFADAVICDIAMRDRKNGES